MALALADLHDPAAFDAIARMLNDDRTRGARGSLLYALRDYDCASLLPQLVEHVLAGAYEERHEAMDLFRGIETVLDAATWWRIRHELRSAIGATDDDRQELIADLLTLFEANTLPS